MSSSPLVSLMDATTGQRIRLASIQVQGVLRRRLLDLGFVPGAVIEVLQASPLGDPVAYRVNNTTIALRREERERILGEIYKEDGE